MYPLKRLAGAVLASALVLCAFALPVTPAHASEPQPFYCSKTYDPASLTTLTQTSTTITCYGVHLGDFVSVSSSIDQALVTATAYVSATDTVTILLVNGSAGTINLASSTWRVRVLPRSLN